MKSEREVAHDVLRAIRQIVRRISEHSKHLSREVGLTVPQLMCLKAIGELRADGAEVSVARLARQVQLSAATVSRIVDRLTRTELVTRTRSSEDRRRVLLALTETGEARFATLPAPLQERFVARFHALPMSERHSILASLYRITELMDATDLDVAPILTADPAEPVEPL